MAAILGIMHNYLLVFFTIGVFVVAGGIGMVKAQNYSK